MEVVGRVSALWRFPVKSMVGEPLERTPFGPDGIPGDRGVAVIDVETGRVLGAKAVERLLLLRAFARPGGPVIRFPDGRALYALDASEAVSELIGRRVRLEVAQGDDTRTPIQREDGTTYLSRPGGFFDARPVHIVGTHTLATLSSLYDGAFDARRFRANIVVDTGVSEQDWIGAELAAGDARFEVTEPCARCAVTTAAQDDLPKDRGILSTVAQKADNVVGVYAAVRTAGMVAVGDEVVLRRA